MYFPATEQLESERGSADGRFEQDWLGCIGTLDGEVTYRKTSRTRNIFIKNFYLHCGIAFKFYQERPWTELGHIQINRNSGKR